MILSSNLIYGNIVMLTNYLKSNKEDFKFETLAIPLPIKNVKILELCKSIYSEIESGIYSKYDLIIYYLYQKLMNNKFYITQINRKEIESTSKLISKKQLKIDIEIVDEYLNTLKLESYQQLFELNDEHGCNLVYKITKSKTISPSFYLEHFKKYKYSKDSKLDDFKQFEKTINLIFNVIRFNRKGSL